MIENIFWDEYPDNDLPLPDIGPCMKHGAMRCLECCDELDFALDNLIAENKP